MKVKTFFSHFFFFAIFISYYTFANDIEESSQTDATDDNIRGLVKPIEKAVISGELAGKIKKIPFKAGDNFKKGDTLVKFQCSKHQASLSSAEANLKSKRNIYKNNKKLLELNSISDIEVSISKSEMDMARAERTIQALKVSKCKIKAPYSGRVIDVIVNEHETIVANKEILSILNDSNLEIELIVPSNWLNWIKKGYSFSFMVDETGKVLEGKVAKIGAIVDPVSQTVKLIGKFDDDFEDVLSGMSGTAKFQKPS